MRTSVRTFRKYHIAKPLYKSMYSRIYTYSTFSTYPRIDPPVPGISAPTHSHMCGMCRYQQLQREQRFVLSPTRACAHIQGAKDAYSTKRTACILMWKNLHTSHGFLDRHQARWCRGAWACSDAHESAGPIRFAQSVLQRSDVRNLWRATHRGDNSVFEKCRESLSPVWTIATCWH